MLILYDNFFKWKFPKVYAVLNASLARVFSLVIKSNEVKISY